MTATEAFRDDGCATDATVATFFVNSLGETFGERGDNVGSMNLSVLAENNGLDWSTVCSYNRSDNTPQSNRWHALIEAEWQRLYAANLNPKEHAFLLRVNELASLVNFGQFRVYGEIRPTDEEVIVVVTEFEAFTDEAAFWKKVLKIADDTKANVWVMREDAHHDRSKKAGDAEWTNGPDHGREERQVELAWRIDHLNKETFPPYLKMLSETTDALWKKQGVSVM